MARRMLSRLEDTLAREGRSARGGRGLRASAGSPIRHNSCLDFCTRVRSSAACSMACHNQPDTHTIKSWRKTIDQDGRVRGSDHRSLEWRAPDTAHLTILKELAFFDELAKLAHVERA